MKRKGIFFLVIFVFFFVTGCNNLELKEGAKTEFEIGEKATLDYYQIELKDAYYEDQLHVLFDVYNKTDENHIINLDDQFVFNVDGNQISNQDTSKQVSVAPKSKTTIELQYDTSKQEKYEILFYSGLVGNNIKFLLDVK